MKINNIELEPGEIYFRLLKNINELHKVGRKYQCFGGLVSGVVVKDFYITERKLSFKSNMVNKITLKRFSFTQIAPLALGQITQLDPSDTNPLQADYG